MKHLFFVHSNITYLVSLGIIKKLNLKKEEVCFIFGRAYNFYCEYDKFWIGDFVKFEQTSPLAGKFFYFRNRKLINKFDELIAQKTKDKQFTVYLPHDWNFTMQLLMTHKNCHSYNFIEEGLLHFKEKLHLEFKNIFFIIKLAKNILNTGFRSLYYNTKKRKKYKLFIISEQIKQLNYKCEMVLVPLYFPTNNDVSEYNNSNIFIFDSFVYKTNAIIEICKAVDFLLAKEPKNKWFIKTHPHTPDKILKEIENIFKKYSMDYKIIENSIIFGEEIIFKGENIKFFGFYSSLIYYSAISSHKSYTLVQYSLKSKHPELINQFEGASFPKNYHKQVKIYE